MAKKPKEVKTAATQKDEALFEALDKNKKRKKDRGRFSVLFFKTENRPLS